MSVDEYGTHQHGHTEDSIALSLGKWDKDIIKLKPVRQSCLTFSHSSIQTKIFIYFHSVEEKAVWGHI